MPLPYTTQSLCPECFQVIPAEIKAENGKVIIEKECPEHGFYKDTYWGSEEDFLKAEKWWCDGRLDNPRTESIKGCPQDCGLCPEHKSHTGLALIDVTNRCNLACPICFANARTSGYVYEPTLEEIRGILENLRANKPVPAPAVQFAGGEPTVREELPEIIAMASELGFKHIEIASNGLKIAESADYLMQLQEAGLRTIYFQFDGITPEPYIAARGKDLFPAKRKVIENARKVGFDSIVLVPTLVRGVNDMQVGGIIDFAIQNIDVVRGIIFQPVSITGRIDREKLDEMRITIPDLTRLAEEQTGGTIKAEDWYPVSSIATFSKTLGYYRGKPTVEFTCSPHCGMATYIFIEEGEIQPITGFVNIEKFFGTLKNVNKDYERDSRYGRLKAKLRLFFSLRHFKEKGRVLKLVRNIMKNHSYDELGDFSRQSMLIGAMHFMDPYNYDLQRVNHCCIHYGIPDGRIIPFCAYNTLHRETVEKEFSMSIDEWRRRRGKQTVEVEI